MTPEDNREIAEWCGLCSGKSHRVKQEEWSVSEWECDVCKRPQAATSSGQLCDPRIKFDTLDACAEFEETADCNRLLISYLRALHEVRFPEPMHRDLHQTPDIYAQALWMATPEQRCEAILQVIREAKA